MQEYPNNSKTVRVSKTTASAPSKAAPAEQKPKVERIVQSEVKRRKKPLGKRLRDTFFGGEDARGVFGYVVSDVLAPAARDMVADAVSQGVERLIFGEVRGHVRRGPSRREGGLVNYSSKSTTLRRDPRDDRREISSRARRNHEFDEIILGSRAEANEVIDRLYLLIDQFEQASVSDLYEMVGITGAYTDEKWGWEDLRGASVHHTRHGYVLDLPPTMPLT